MTQTGAVKPSAKKETTEPMATYEQNAWAVFENNFGIQTGETILVVTDDSLKEVATYFYEAGKIHKHETVLMVMPAIYTSGEEPPRAIAEVMKASDVVVCITEASLTHTKARKEASAKGARVGTMPGFTLDMLEEGAITGDPAVIQELTDTYTTLLQDGSTVRIEKDGHVLTFSIQGRNGIPSTGIFLQKGEAGNIPSGESYIAPLEDSANGTFLVDGSIAELGTVTEPVLLTLENGRLVDATGPQGKALLELLGEGKGRQIAEFGIGTNPSARLTGVVLEDEKVYGTVHIAFGSNKPFGGVTEAGVHIDCVTKAPSVWIDDVLIP